MVGFNTSTNPLTGMQNNGGVTPTNGNFQANGTFLDLSPPPEHADRTVFAGATNMGNGLWVNASVAKVEDFCPENPVFIVSGTDVCGTRFEVTVNVREVDPRNASLIEMYALNAYRSVNGLRRIPMNIAGVDANGNLTSKVANAFQTADFLSPLMELIAMQRASGNWEAYFALREMGEWLSQFPRG